MAKLGDLIVKVGADTADFNAKLGKMQREMRRMTGNIEAMGRSMTRSLTLPIAALGAAAVKSAADIESLEVSFISLTGSAAGAADMMQNLNEFAAKTPFQVENIANAARQLIASGTEVSKVNEQLQFLGDIAATSGNQIEDIAAIFAKVNAKGKVELESLNQLAERGIPIFKELSEATGLPADKLGAGRVSVEQFNEVLKGMASEGGFAYGAMERLSETTAGQLSTAIDMGKQALAEFGALILPVINQVLQGVIKLADKFKKLSPATKDIILRIATFLATLGPSIVLFSKVASGIRMVVVALKTMRVAIMTNPIGLLAVGLATLAASFIDFGLAMDGPIDKLKEFKERIEGLSADIRISEIEKEIKKFTETLETQQKQLRAILRMNPEMYGTEGYSYLYDQTVGKTKKELEELQLLLFRAKADLYEKEQADKRAAAAAKAHADALADFNERARLYNDLHGMQMAELLDTTADKINTKMLPALEDLGLEIEDSFVNDFRVMPWAEEAFEKMLKLREAARAVRLEVQSIVQDATARVLEDLGSALGAALSSAQDGFNLMAATLRNLGSMLQEIGKLLIKTAVSFITFKKTLFTNPVAAAAAGIAFVAAGALLKAKADQFEAPALAQGGLAYGPTMALVGDNRSASIDPEVIAPLSKLRDMMGGNTVEVVGRISGNDIFLSNARATTSRNRYA